MTATRRVAPVAIAGTDADINGHIAAATPCPAEQSFIALTCTDAKHTAELARRMNVVKADIPIIFRAIMII